MNNYVITATSDGKTSCRFGDSAGGHTAFFDRNGRFVIQSDDGNERRFSAVDLVHLIKLKGNHHGHN